ASRTPPLTLFPYPTLFRSLRRTAGRRDDRLRQMRQADAAQALALRAVLRLHRLSRLQEHEGPAPAEGGHSHRAAAAVRELRQGRSEEHTSELQSPCNLVCR